MFFSSPAGPDHFLGGGGHVASVNEYQELFFPGAVWAGHKAEIEN